MNLTEYETSVLKRFMDHKATKGNTANRPFLNAEMVFTSFLIALSIVYLATELPFASLLVDRLATGASASEIEHMETFGRSMFGFAVGLFVTGWIGSCLIKNGTNAFRLIAYCIVVFGLSASIASFSQRHLVNAIAEGTSGAWRLDALMTQSASSENRDTQGADPYGRAISTASKIAALSNHGIVRESDIRAYLSDEAVTDSETFAKETLPSVFDTIERLRIAAESKKKEMGRPNLNTPEAHKRLAKLDEPERRALLANSADIRDFYADSYIMGMVLRAIGITAYDQPINPYMDRKAVDRLFNASKSSMKNSVAGRLAKATPYDLSNDGELSSIGKSVSRSLMLPFLALAFSALGSLMHIGKVVSLMMKFVGVRSFGIRAIGMSLPVVLAVSVPGATNASTYTTTVIPELVATAHANIYRIGQPLQELPHWATLSGLALGQIPSTFTLASAAAKKGSKRLIPIPTSRPDRS